MPKAQDELRRLSREKLIELIVLLGKELDVTDELLEEYNRVMEAIPPCPAHGHQCVPHALGWIKKQKGNPGLEELNEWLLGR